MKKTLLGLFALFLFVFVLSQVVRADVYTSYVRVTQEGSTDAFDGSFTDGTGAAFRFILNDFADSVKVHIKSASTGQTVKTIVATNLSDGENFVLWNGSTDTGPLDPAPAGSYQLELTAYSQGYATYTEFFIDYPPIFTRGVTSVTNPALRWFGFIYAVSGGGYATGLARHSADGRQYGDSAGTALLTTTGIALGTGERRYAATADEDGYIWVLRGALNGPYEVYRLHTDSLNATLVDSIAASQATFTGRMHGLDVVGTGANKALIISAYNMIARMPIGTAATFNGKLDTLVLADAGWKNRFWDAQVGEDGSLYVCFDDEPNGLFRGVSKFNITGITSPRTMADTVWTRFFADGDPITLAIWPGATPSASDDILYLSMDVAGGATDPSGVYAFTNLDASRPTVNLIYQDPENNTTQVRGTVTLDVVGNIIFFENSNEHTSLISPPTGPNSYAYTFIDPVTITSAGVTAPLIDIALARQDLNGDFQPDLLGDTVKVIGVVNSVNIQTTNTQYYLQDETGGISLFHTGTGGPPLQFGDKVQIRGAIAYFRGLTEITPPDPATDVIVLDSNQTVTAIPLTVSQYLANPEQYESRRIKLSVVDPLFQPSQWPASGSDANLNVWDGIASLVLRIDKETEVDGSTMPTFPVELTGTATQFTSSASVHNDGYQITPMYTTDFVPINAPPVALFELLTPADGSTVTLDDSAQVVTFSWRKSIDFNEDAVIYQWVPIGFNAKLSNNNGADTVLTQTGEQLLVYLGAGDSVTLRWTVKSKDPTHSPVSNLDTSTVKIKRGTITGIAEDSSIPREFYLHQNYPNPFNPSTTISYGLPQGVRVRLDVFNILGQKVTTLVNEEQQPGRYRVTFAASRYSSGTYFYILNAGDRIFKKKMLLVK